MMMRFSLVFSFLAVTAVSAWTVPRISSNNPHSTTRLYNIPPPSLNDAKAFKEYADKQPPPASFFELQQDCTKAAQLALRDGHKLIEIEFPPLPANVLEMDDVSAYEISNANLNLAIDFAKGIMAATIDDPESATYNKIAILLPDEAEADIATEKMLGGAKNPYPGITVGSLLESEEGDERIIKPEQLFLNLFGGGSGGIVRAREDVDMYICIVASAQELPDIEELSQLEPDKPIVFFNLKLDVLRGDLGAPAFPPREFQDRFLSRVKPVYFLRTRQYSRSTPNPPFLINFQGCLFRSYPGQFQTLLDTGTGRYRRVKGNDVRPPLGGFKEELTEALRETGVIEEEGKTLNFLRTGYKTTTWWEEEREDASDEWRT
ncbi:Domain of unknown function (DUF1995) [Seminavis robusta]|uniref:DUF1995 domain-containing protein n=1 Tax=Seminavis robusta TaxID=568900 RepID=A0A9N8D873_9STRA|nr:Domain of unknown function (DUF1995) [Seminavis robusta]|eukprot:Sro37_g023090.1 Domain of unknown function (DUF1995) (376) ;mRNA; r:25870-27182